MIKVLFLGENINTLTGGIVTVMKQLIDDYEISRNVSYDIVYTTSNRISGFIKVKDWIIALFKFFLKIGKCDLVHVHHASNANFWLTGLMVYVAKIRRKKIILHNHAGDFFIFYEGCNSIKKRAVKWILRNATINLVLSQSWLNRYSELEPKANWKVLKNSVTVNSYVESSRWNNPKRFIFIGRVEQAKGVFDLLAVLDKIYLLVPDFELYIAGSDDLNVLPKLLNGKIWKENIKLLGFISPKERDHLLSECNFFILPSYHEGLPMSLLESMAHGVIPIATNVGGIPEVITDNLNGFLIKPGKPEKIIEIVAAIINNNELLQQISLQSYNTINHNYNFNLYRQELLSLYKQYSHAA